MIENELQQRMNNLKEKLMRAQKQVAVLREKTKLLEEQCVDSRQREQHSNELVMELIERQRELNVMLNRANIMLNRTQEAIALTSIEFNEMAKALPEPKKAEWSERVAKINELFKKTGIHDAEISELGAPSVQQDSLESDELKEESKTAFGRFDSLWNKKKKSEPPRVDGEIVEDDALSNVEGVAVDEKQHADEADEVIEQAPVQEVDINAEDEERLMFKQRKKSWWQRMAG